MDPRYAPPRQIWVTVIQDRRGRPAMIHRSGKYAVLTSKGYLREITWNGSLELVDGTVWSTSLLSGNQPIRLGTCELCRYPRFALLKREQPTHGLCSLANLHICRCGEPACPRHARECPDGIWRCVNCADRWRTYQRLRQIGWLCLWPFVRKEE